MSEKSMNLFSASNAAAIFIMTVFSVTGSADAQPNTANLQLFDIVAGAPDLTVHLRAAPTLIWDMPNAPLTHKVSSTITIRLENRLTPAGPPRPVHSGERLRLYGSEARGVLVSVSMPALLRQVLPPGSSAQFPGGFQCAGMTNNLVWCWGPTIPVSGVVELWFDVIGTFSRDCPEKSPEDVTQVVQALADPYDWITEASETNNEGIVPITHETMCIG
jgi:hypothetical protein